MRSGVCLGVSVALAAMSNACAPQPYYSSPGYAYRPAYAYQAVSYPTVQSGYYPVYYSTSQPHHYQSKWDYYRNYNGISPPPESM